MYIVVMQESIYLFVKDYFSFVFCSCCTLGYACLASYFNFCLLCSDSKSSRYVYV